MARRWVKLWVSESLRGTIRFDLTPSERSVWYDLLALAGDCRQEGLIAPGEHQAYPLRWIAGTLNISTSLLQRTLKKCKTLSRIDVNGSGILILNWNKYQSEYERQKPFRGKKVTNKVTQKLPVEEEVDIEEEVEKKYIKKEIILPDFINKELWDAFLEMRKKKRAEPTEYAIGLLIKKLEKIRAAGDDPNEVLERSIMGGWTGIFSLDQKGGQGGTHQRDSKKTTDADRRRGIA